MADEDEIDILGDFQLDTNTNLFDGGPLISENSELLNCDYTIHPQWLLDRPSTNPDNWYDTKISTNLVEKPQPPEIDALGHLSTENSITDESGWTEKEKNLLERGMEIFGKSNVRLSQFIGSKTAPEVKYYLKNFYLENHVNKSVDCTIEGDILDDTQIPASIEEVIAAVSTGKPTVYRPKIGDRELLNKDGPLKRKSNSLSKDGALKRKSHSDNGLVKFKITSKLKAPFKYKTPTKLQKKNTSGQFKRAAITTGKGLAVPISQGEEIIKLTQTSEDSDTEVEVDIESSEEENTEIYSNVKLTPTGISEENLAKSEQQVNNPTSSNINLLATVNEAIAKELTSLETPKHEIILSERVTDLEKVLNDDYFSGNSSKTPERYLKIRNHILNGWSKQKPKYLNKTISRQGLKNCGDVNSFGKVHYFLEQIGAINFGCEQVYYERPLIEVLQEKMIARDKKKCENKLIQRDANISTDRARNKRKFNHDGEGGYTMSHDEQGRVIKHTIINEDPVIKSKPYVKKPIIRLVYCRPFKNEISQPYRIKLKLSTLLTMDFHAHMRFSEIMGLVAGNWSQEERTMFISHYEPCLNIASSATHCDMCPISQAKAADIIHERGLDILGWFHSHPTFAPEPSHQDLETQQSVQRWIGRNKPCIGMIMSPFSLNGALVASPFRCMIVQQIKNVCDSQQQLVPFKFKVDIEGESFDVEEFFKNLTRIIKFPDDVDHRQKVNFLKPCFCSSNITYMEKYITSVRMHLAKLGTLDKTTVEEIVDGITKICYSSVNI